MKIVWFPLNRIGLIHLDWKCHWTRFYARRSFPHQRFIALTISARSFSLLFNRGAHLETCAYLSTLLVKNLALISGTEQNAIFVVVIPIKSNNHHMHSSWYITIHLKRHDSFIWTAHAHDCITGKDLIAKLFLLMRRSWSRQISLTLPVFEIEFFASVIAVEQTRTDALKCVRQRQANRLSLITEEFLYLNVKRIIFQVYRITLVKYREYVCLAAVNTLFFIVIDMILLLLLLDKEEEEEECR